MLHGGFFRTSSSERFYVAQAATEVLTQSKSIQARISAAPALFFSRKIGSWLRLLSFEVSRKVGRKMYK